MTVSQPLNNQMQRVVWAEGISNFGSMLSRLAIPWIASLALDATPAQMAGLVVADMVAGAIGSLCLGPGIDRMPKRRTMRVCDGARALLLVVLAVGAAADALGMTALVAAALVAGVLNVGFELARSAWVAQQVATSDLPRANAQLSMAGSVSETLAFAGGGWLYQWAGAVWALLVDAASYAGSVLLLRGIREAVPVPRPVSQRRLVPDWWADQRQGWISLTAHPVLRALMAVAALRAFGFGLIGTSYMVFVSRDLGLPTGVQGLLFALGAAGALIGAAFAPRLPAHAALAGGLLLAAAGSACLPLAHGAGWVAMVLIATQQIVGDAGEVMYGVHDQSLRQACAPGAQLARVDAGVRSVAQLGTLAGAVVGGALGTLQSPRAVLALGAAALALAALYAGARLSRRVRVNRVAS